MRHGGLRNSWRAWLPVALIPLAWLPYLVKWRLGLHSDAAVPFLMARRMFDGEFPAYYWRQNYLGALDSYLVAGLMTVFGRDHVWLSYLPPLAAYLAASAILVRMAPRPERAARACCLLFAPPSLFLAIARPAFTQDAMLWCAWAAVVAIAPGLDDEPRARRAWLRAGGAGLVLAVFTWRIPTALAVLVPLAIVVALSALLARRARQDARLAVRAAQLAAVFVVAQLYRVPGWIAGVTPDMFTRLDLAGVGARVAALPRALMQFDPRGAFGNTISGTYTYYSGMPPGVFGEPYPSLLVRSPAGVVIVTLVMLAVLAGLVLIARDVVRVPGTSPAGLPRATAEHASWLILFLMVLAGFVSHPSVWDMGGARYLAALFFPMVVAIGVLVSRLPRTRMARSAVFAAAAAWCALVAAGHARMLALEDGFDRDLEAAIGWIRESGRTAGLADYSLAYIVTAMTRESLILDPAYNRRYAPYADFVSAQPAFALVEWKARIAEGKRLRVPPGEYDLDGARDFGEITVTLLRRGEAAGAGRPGVAPPP